MKTDDGADGQLSDSGAPFCSCGELCSSLSPQPNHSREVIAYHTGLYGGVMGATGDGLEWRTYDFSKVTAVALFTKSDELGLQPDLLCAAHKHNTRVIDWGVFVGEVSGAHVLPPLR